MDIYHILVFLDKFLMNQFYFMGFFCNLIIIYHSQLLNIIFSLIINIKQFISPGGDLNPRPRDYESRALPD